MQVSTPCGALALRKRGNHMVARLSADRPWLDQARLTTQWLASVTHTGLPPIVDCAFVDDTLEVVYAPRPTLEPLTDRTQVVPMLLAVADLADVVGMLSALPDPVRCGPVPPVLVMRDEQGTQLIGAGLWANAYELDRTRRATMSPRHFIESPESLAGLPITEKTDCYHLAYVTYQLLTDHEPFPTERGESDYQQAVIEGRSHSLQLLRMDLPLELAGILKRGLALDPNQRPTPFDFGYILREFTGVPKKVSTDPAKRKPWWQLW